MNCPFCGAEMQRGWIQSRDKLGWSAKKVIFLDALAGLLAEVPLGTRIITWRCPDCGKLVIDPAEQPRE